MTNNNYTNNLVLFPKLELVKNELLKGQIIESMISGECTVPEDLVTKFSLTYSQVTSLLNDPGFISSVANNTNAKLFMNHHTKAIPRLLDIVDQGDDKVAMQAIKLIAQLSNNLKTSNTDVNINLNLETLVKESEKNVSPNFIDLQQGVQ